MKDLPMIRHYGPPQATLALMRIEQSQERSKVVQLPQCKTAARRRKEPAQLIPFVGGRSNG